MQNENADVDLDFEVDRLYSSTFKDEVDLSQEETIGLLGARPAGDATLELTRRSRYARVLQILSVVRKYDILHGITPRTLRHMLEELGPMFVKAGQILSMRSEILPKAFCDELAKLRTEVTPMPMDQVLDTLREEYDVPIERIFSSIDDEPLGSASVAQVHRATLANGDAVAIKVQRAGIRNVMAQDIEIMRSIAKHAKRIMGDEQVLDIKSVVEELWQSFREETDFLVEAHALEEFKRNNANCAFIACPKPYPALCTEHVIVMEYVEGIPISQTTKLVEEGYDLEEIGIKLVDNYASQLLDDGFFHADPHPGNLVISGGKIVYLDLGLMGRLSAHDRNALSDIVFAIADLDTPRLKDGLLRFAVSSDLSVIDHGRLLTDIDAVVQEYGNTALADLDLSQCLNAIISLARRNGIELPGSVTMMARSVVTLEGTVDDLLADQSIIYILAQHIASNTSFVDASRGEAERLAREIRLATHGLLRAGSQASLAMDMLTRGQLKANLELSGSSHLMSNLGNVIDRLTMGIVIAGLFIGSSVIYIAGMEPLFIGIPIIGFLGFFIAFILGVLLFVGILRESKHQR